MPGRWTPWLPPDNHRAVFDAVTSNPASIVWTSAKFHDFARLEAPPARVAVVRRKADLGDLLAVSSQAARVVEEDAPNRVLSRAALAAKASALGEQFLQHAKYTCLSGQPTLRT